MKAGEKAARKKKAARSSQDAGLDDVPGYVIVTCSYTPNSAGIGCLYRLCDELNRRGYPSFMSGGRETAPHLDAPLIETEAARELCDRGYTAIYPETISGNPLNARSVVRWVLNRPGLLGGDEIYDDSEQVFYYSNVFLPYIKNRIAGKLYMPTIDERIFWCDDDGELSRRSLECFYVGKSQWQEGLIDRSRVFEITRESPAKKELGKLLRATRVLYCFDNSTILVYEALLCGCRVVVIPDGTQSKRDYEQLELGIDGIAWGMEELGAVQPNVSQLRRRYERMSRDFQTQLELLIEKTQGVAFDAAEAARRLALAAEAKARWTRRAMGICKSTVREALKAGRTAERTIRRARKRWLQQLFARQVVEQASPDEEARHFYCEDPDLAKRKLECVYFGKSRRRAGMVDLNTVFEIATDTSSEQVGKLLRASRMLHTVSGENAMIQRARLCGCPVRMFNPKRKLDSSAA